ncbi:hypothetical protein AUJ16_03260 [Candidatus Micrarchaeota archaeon CG1_02_60_51]|nr:MAG: hypothetical protein AUJ16_03260 [Candidatus Micrarchaeota archaeon CG1_02_60_51]
MRGFVFTIEALLALLAVLGLLAFQPAASAAPLRLQEYRLCQDAAEISVKAHSAELAAFWRSGAEPAFLGELAADAGATGYEIEVAGRVAGGCEGDKVAANRIICGAGEFERLSLTLCYPPK